MSDLKDLKTELSSVVSRLRARKRVLNAVDGAARSTMVTAMVCCAAALIGAVYAPAWLREHWAWMFLPIPLGLALGAIIGACLPLDDLRLARALDDAAKSEDRFASALQLAKNRKAGRVLLLMQDAMRRVAGTSSGEALPMRLWRGTVWIPLPIITLLVILLVVPEPIADGPAPATQISADEWSSMQDAYEKELERLFDAEKDEDNELTRQLEELGKLLEREPDKREALSAIASLRNSLEKQQKALSPNSEKTLRDAAEAMRRNKELRKVADMLKQGKYGDASRELRSIADKLASKAMNPTAQEFGEISADLQDLALQLASTDELQQSAQQAANAASSMNRNALSESLRRLAQQVDQNADTMRQMDQIRKARNLLERLQQMLNQSGQCSGCESGCSSCAGGGGGGLVRGGQKRPGAKKGGLKAGRGSMAEWGNGGLGDQEEQREESMVNVQERDGLVSSFTVTSSDEDAESALTYEELYVDLVHRAEADLDLESVPVAYREYLRRYFNAIKPVEDSAETSEPEP